MINWQKDEGWAPARGRNAFNCAGEWGANQLIIRARQLQMTGSVDRRKVLRFSTKSLRGPDIFPPSPDEEKLPQIIIMNCYLFVTPSTPATSPFGKLLKLLHSFLLRRGLSPSPDGPWWWSSLFVVSINTLSGGGQRTFPHQSQVARNYFLKIFVIGINWQQ